MLQSLAAGADVEAALVEPRDRAMRFKMCVLYAMRGVGALVDHVSRFEPCLDVANVAVKFEQDIPRGAPDAGFGAFVVDDG